MRVRERKQRQESEGLSATRTATPTEENPTGREYCFSPIAFRDVVWKIGRLETATLPLPDYGRVARHPPSIRNQPPRVGALSPNDTNGPKFRDTRWSIEEELMCVNRSRTARPKRTCTHHSLSYLPQQRVGNPHPNRRLLNIRIHHHGLPGNQS